MTDLNNIEAYDYDLPEEMIAQTPVEPRDSSKMLVYHKESGKIEHKIFRDIKDYFKKGDVLVLNNSRVLPARLLGIKEETGAKIEFLLQKRIDLFTWKIVAKPTKRLKPGTNVKFSDKLSAEVISVGDFGECEVRFNCKRGSFEENLHEIGSMPLPHYIKSKLNDSERYQTVYSKTEGSSAAPTAGLHFTTELLDELKKMGVIIVEVMLHVGLGTFRPVSVTDITQHKMHYEYFEISKTVADVINKAKKEKRRVIACGTTSVRTLESAVDDNCEVQAIKKETNIFIHPPYKFKIVDALITNFHLPKSTLIMLVSAFIGREETLNLYKTAVENNYRFFSFGDATLLI